MTFRKHIFRSIRRSFEYDRQPLPRRRLPLGGIYHYICKPSEGARARRVGTASLQEKRNNSVKFEGRYLN